jgi:hypothetical protein
MKVLSLLVTVSGLAIAQAATSCFVDQKDGIQLEVNEGDFYNPDFCGKICQCTVSYPDPESGNPLYSTTCGCNFETADGELFCFEDQEAGFLPEKGLCRCTTGAGSENDFLECNLPFDPTPSPTLAPVKTPMPSTAPSTAPVASGGGGGGGGGGSAGANIPMALALLVAIISVFFLSL